MDARSFSVTNWARLHCRLSLTTLFWARTGVVGGARHKVATRLSNNLLLECYFDLFEREQRELLASDVEMMTGVRAFAATVDVVAVQNKEVSPCKRCQRRETNAAESGSPASPAQFWNLIRFDPSASSFPNLKQLLNPDAKHKSAYHLLAPACSCLRLDPDMAYRERIWYSLKILKRPRKAGRFGHPGGHEDHAAPNHSIGS